MPTDDRHNRHEQGEGWVGLAWREWCRAQQNYAALARQFGKDPETVKRNLKKYAAARAAEQDDLDPTMEYLDGLRHDLHEALEVYRTVGPDNPNAQVGALKLAAQIRKDIAAACGVTTDRKTVGVGQAHALRVTDRTPLEDYSLRTAEREPYGRVRDELRTGLYRTGTVERSRYRIVMGAAGRSGASPLASSPRRTGSGPGAEILTPAGRWRDPRARRGSNVGGRRLQPYE